jgi:hypothetical protein
MTMDTHIGSVQSTIRAVDGGSLLSPEMMERIVRAVLQAVEDQAERRRRIESERRVTPGAAYELEREEG